MKTHIEHYSFGYVVCEGEYYGNAISKAFLLREEAEAFKRQWDEEMAAAQKALREAQEQMFSPNVRRKS